MEEEEKIGEKARLRAYCSLCETGRVKMSSRDNDSVMYSHYDGVGGGDGDDDKKNVMVASAARRSASVLHHLNYNLIESNEYGNSTSPISRYNLLPVKSSYSPALSASNDDIVIVSAVRTPHTRARRGGLKDTPADDLVCTVVEAVLAKSGGKVAAAEIGDVVFGSVLGPSSQRANEVRRIMNLRELGK